MALQYKGNHRESQEVNMLTKQVNGVKRECTPEEEAEILADRAANNLIIAKQREERAKAKEAKQKAIEALKAKLGLSDAELELLRK